MNATALEANAVHVWLAQLDAGSGRLDRAWESLDREERERARRFRFETHRENFILSHGFVREVLARYLETDAGRIEFSRDAYGKPHVTGGGIEFNLSHSHKMAVVAVSAGRRVGVDIEAIREMADLEGVAHRIFSESEQALLAARPGERTGAFFRCWARMEAYVKAVGTGLAIPLSSLDAAEGGFWLCDLPLVEGYAGAVAVEGHGAELVYGEWESASTHAVPKGIKSGCE